MKKNFTLLACGAILMSAVIDAQTPVSSYTISTRNATISSNTSTGWNAAAPYPAATTFTNYYGRKSGGAAGLERVIDGFTIGGVAYAKMPSTGGNPFDKVVINRHPNIPGDTINALYEYTTSVSPNNYLEPSYLGTLAEVINSFVCNRGSDNTFTNTSTSSTYSNIERIDLVKTGGIKVISPARQGFLINERNGNDPFKVAAITSIDGSGNVTGLGNLLSITATNWGKAGPSIITMVMSRRIATDAYLRPKQTLTAQTISGVFIPFTNLGLAAGTTIYGLAVFPADVTASMDLIGLTNVPANTAETDGGLDMMAGGGFFVESSLLPVHFSSFTAKAANNGQVELNWITASETNNQYFAIERSAGNNSWVIIGRVEAGNNKGANQYSFIDKQPANGINNYRLKQVDMDGTFSYSTIVSAIVQSQSAATIYPNPAQDKVHINYTAASGKSVTIYIVNSQGRRVKTVNATTQTDITIPVNNLSDGVYFIQIKDGNETKKAGSFVIRK